MSIKLNELETTVTDFSTAELDKSAQAQANFEATQDVDHVREMKKALTKSKYVSKLSNASEASKKYIAKTFEIAALLEVFKASYSVDKLLELSEALATSNKTALKSAVMQNMIATLVSDEKEVHTFKSYSRAVAHSTDTQVSQTLALLKRLNIVSEYSRKDDVVRLNQQSKVLKAIHKIYE
jgi:hypothetical protein